MVRIGLTLIVIHFLLRLVDLNNPNPFNAELIKLFDGFKDNILWLGVGFIIANVIYVAVLDNMILLWNKIILPDIKTNIDMVSSQYVSAVRSDTVNKVLDLAEKSDIKSNVKPIFSKLYGDHCVKEKGLFQYISREIFPFLESERVHRSSYTKKISIEEKETGHIWHEVCEFSLHCIALDEDYDNDSTIEEYQYQLNYNPTMKVSEFPDRLEEIWQLKIEIETNDSDSGERKKELIFNSKDVLTIENDKIVKSDDIGCELEVDIVNDEFFCRFRKNLNLTHAYTKICITETSYVPENYFTLATREPSCGMDIDIHLPPNWEFEDYVLFDRDKSWSTSLHPSNRLSCHTNGWVLPGIVFNCHWRKTE